MPVLVAVQSSVVLVAVTALQKGTTRICLHPFRVDLFSSENEPTALGGGTHQIEVPTDRVECGKPARRVRGCRETMPRHDPWRGGPRVDAMITLCKM